MCLQSQSSYGKEPHPLFGLVRGAYVKKIAVSGIHNRLNYCVMLIVYTQFINVAAGHILHPSGPRV